ncbi:hypothetical protein G7L32_02305 [Klebsiella quasipneumoniae]|nr:hypothetical protein [Klebsiella quasipneumoniae]
MVYMAPLVGLFVMASIFQVLFASDIASLCARCWAASAGSWWRAVCRRSWQRASRGSR